MHSSQGGVGQEQEGNVFLGDALCEAVGLLCVCSGVTDAFEAVLVGVVCGLSQREKGSRFLGFSTYQVFWALSQRAPSALA